MNINRKKELRIVRRQESCEWLASAQISSSGAWRFHAGAARLCSSDSMGWKRKRARLRALHRASVSQPWALILRYADARGRPMNNAVFCHAHARVRIVGGRAAGLKVYDDREVGA